MTDILLAAALVLLVLAIILLLLLWRKTSQTDAAVIAPRLDAFDKAQERTERAVREEVAQSRDELGKAAREQRQELTEAFKTLGDSVVQRMSEVAATQKGQLEAFSGQLGSFATASVERLDAVRAESATGGKHLREEVVATLKALADTITQTMGELGNVQKSQLEAFSGQLRSFAQASGERLDGVRAESAVGAKQLREEVVTTLKSISETMAKTMSELANVQKNQLDAFSGQLGSFAKSSGERLDGVRAESATGAKLLREEVVATLKSISETMAKTMSELANLQKNQLEAFSTQLGSFAQSSSEKLDGVRAESATGAKLLREEVVATLKSISETMAKTMKDLAIAEKAQLDAFSGQIASLTRTSGEKLDGIRTESTTGAKQLREEVVAALKGITESTTKTMSELASLQKAQLEAMSAAIGKLSESNEKKLEAVRVTVEGKLQTIQVENAKQLDLMRQTVDEKLQGTLEKRLGESFKQVSERLEQVYKGLGEMQTLATGVGDLKKVLTNVKTRGTWGEVQLGAMLEQVLNPDQFATNVATKGDGERVEFAIKMPGRSDDKDETVWLPIDAKFPIEDYQRLLDAQEKADVEAVEAAGKALEARVKACAWDICEKYVSPPKTTDFGILFLPIEGLFAEVIRRTGLAEVIQRECRVVIAGPTTLWSILNSLQMGFRTLAIEKRSSEVWNLLAAVKTEWTKYGEVLDTVQKKLHQASETIDKAQTRTRAIGRKLRDVQELPSSEATALLAVDAAEEDGDAGEALSGPE